MDEADLRTVRWAVAGVHGFVGGLAILAFVLRGIQAGFVYGVIGVPAVVTALVLIVEAPGTWYLVAGTDAWSLGILTVFLWPFLFSGYPLVGINEGVGLSVTVAVMASVALLFHPAIRQPGGDRRGRVGRSRAWIRAGFGAVYVIVGALAISLLAGTLVIQAWGTGIPGVCASAPTPSGIVPASSPSRDRCIPVLPALLLGTAVVSGLAASEATLRRREVGPYLRLLAGVSAMAAGLGLLGRLSRIGPVVALGLVGMGAVGLSGTLHPAVLAPTGGAGDGRR